MSIRVELLEVMGNDLMVANAARVSFDNWKREFDSSDARLIAYLAKHEHTSPFRHPQIQIRCHAPIFLARQLQKHVVGLTWNEVSRRYVDTGIELYTPESWRSRPTDGMKQGSGTEEVTSVAISMGDTTHVFHPDDLVKQFYDNAMQMYSCLIENNVAPEQARMVLPQSMMTSWVWTGSLMAFAHVYKLRIDSHAQREANEFAQKLGEVLEPLFPISWRAIIDN